MAAPIRVESGRDEYASAQFLLRALDEFRKFSADMSIQTVATFLAVASKPGISAKDLEQILGLGQTTASRNILLLSAGPSPTVKGLDLVETRPDELDRRIKRAHLTAKGRRVLASLVDHFQHYRSLSLREE